MRTIIGLFVAMFFLTQLPVTAGASDRTIINWEVAPPSSNAAVTIEVTEDEVQYAVRDGHLWTLFVADHKGQLERFHIVTGDSTIFEWDINNGSVTHGPNVVNVKKWQNYFKKKLVMPAFTLTLGRR
jgi:hypothetical protein